MKHCGNGGNEYFRRPGCVGGKCSVTDRYRYRFLFIIIDFEAERTGRDEAIQSKSLDGFEFVSSDLHNSFAGG